MGIVNPNLITLKCVVFLFFGAIGSLFPFLPIHMTMIGLSKDESIVVSGVSAFVAILGPLIACPLADRLAGGFGGASRSKTGKYLRVMITLCILLATLFYWLLMTVPSINRSQLNVTFSCDQNGGFILQDRCGAERTCYNFNKQRGNISVSNCFFACRTSAPFPTKPPELNTSKTVSTTPAPAPINYNHPENIDYLSENDDDSSGLSPIETIPDMADRAQNFTQNIRDWLRSQFGYSSTENHFMHQLQNPTSTQMYSPTTSQIYTVMNDTTCENRFVGNTSPHLPHTMKDLINENIGDLNRVVPCTSRSNCTADLPRGAVHKRSSGFWNQLTASPMQSKNRLTSELQTYVPIPRQIIPNINEETTPISYQGNVNIPHSNYPLWQTNQQVLALPSPLLQTPTELSKTFAVYTNQQYPQPYQQITDTSTFPSHQQEERNMVTLCNVGRETVLEIIDRTNDVFEVLKVIKPPDGTQQSLNTSYEQKAKVQELLRTIRLLFQRLQSIYKHCNEYCQFQGIQYTHTDSLLSFKDETYQRNDLKKNSEAYKSNYQQYKELKEQVVLRNEQLKETIDHMRNIMWEINTMLSMKKS